MDALAAASAAPEAPPASFVLHLLIGVAISLGGQALGSFGVNLQAASLKDDKRKRETRVIEAVSQAAATPRPAAPSPELVANSNPSSRASTPSGEHATLLVPPPAAASAYSPRPTSRLNQVGEADAAAKTPDPAQASFSGHVRRTLGRFGRLGRGSATGATAFAVSDEPLWHRVRARLHAWRWYIGLGCYIVSQVFGNAVALAFLPTDLVAPLSNSALFFNALFARWLLGIRITRWDILGTVLVTVGAVLISVYGSIASTGSLTLDDLVEMYTRPLFIVYFSAQLSLAIACIVLTKYLEHRLEKDRPFHFAQILAALQRSSDDVGDAVPVDYSSELVAELSPDDAKTPKRKASLCRIDISRGASGGANGESSEALLRAAAEVAVATHGEKVEGARHRAPRSARSMTLVPSDHKIHGIPYHTLPLACACLYSGIGGVLASQTLLIAKSIIVLFSGLMAVSMQYFFGVFFHNFLPPFLLTTMLVSVLTQLYTMNRSLALAPTLTTLTLPVFATWYNALSLINGIIYWDDWDYWRTHQGRLAICIGGVLLNVLGVVFLSLDKSREEQAAEEKAAARVSLLSGPSSPLGPSRSASLHASRSNLASPSG